MDTAHENWPTENINAPLPTDIMCGRGRGTNIHPGNVDYRQMVEERKAEYRAANSRRKKRMIVFNIVRECREQGRTFLKPSEATGNWYDVGDDKARDKTSQALREKPKDELQQEVKTNDTTATATSNIERSTLQRDFSPESAEFLLEDAEKGNSDPETERSFATGQISPTNFSSTVGQSDDLSTESCCDRLTFDDLLEDDDTAPVCVSSNQGQAPSLVTPPSTKRYVSFTILDVAPSKKRRVSSSWIPSATSNHLKEIFMDQVMKDEMSMEDFVHTCMGLCSGSNLEANEFEPKVTPLDCPSGSTISFDEDDRERSEEPEKSWSDMFPLNILSD